jgi:excisionase family DNA binding protein
VSTTISITRICEHCGSEFDARTTVTRYCSHKCNQQAYKARKRVVSIEKSNRQIQHIISKPIEEIKAKPFLSVNEACKLFGISKRTIYRMVDRDELSMAKAGTRTILRRSDFDKLFELPKPEKHKKEQKPVSEFYTVNQIEKQYFVKYRRLNTIINENNIPKIVNNGKLYVSKPHIDRYFKRTRKEANGITEWYTVKEIQDKYKLTRDQVYSRTHENNVPKQRVGKFVKISKMHFDELFQIGV